MERRGFLALLVGLLATPLARFVPPQWKRAPTLADHIKPTDELAHIVEEGFDLEDLPRIRNDIPVGTWVQLYPGVRGPS